jgi:hypothetical protein
MALPWWGWTKLHSPRSLLDLRSQVCEIRSRGIGQGQKRWSPSSRLIYDGLNNMCDGCEGKQGAGKVGCSGVGTEVPCSQRDCERERMLEWADGPVEGRDWPLHVSMLHYLRLKFQVTMLCWCFEISLPGWPSDLKESNGRSKEKNSNFVLAEKSRSQPIWIIQASRNPISTARMVPRNEPRMDT